MSHYPTARARHPHTIYMCTTHEIGQTEAPPPGAQCELRFHHPELYPHPCQIVKSEVDVLIEEPYTEEA